LKHGSTHSKNYFFIDNFLNIFSITSGYCSTTRNRLPGLDLNSTSVLKILDSLKNRIDSDVSNLNRSYFSHQLFLQLKVHLREIQNFDRIVKNQNFEIIIDGMNCFFYIDKPFISEKVI
jgi:hypothetical protein